MLGGIGHTYGVLNFYKDPSTLFWSLTATVLIFLLAAINLLRTWRPGDRALAILTSCASAAYLVISLRFGQLIDDLTDPRVILFSVLSAGLAAFGLRQAMQGRGSSIQM
jgi:hypothetical protein